MSARLGAVAEESHATREITANGICVVITTFDPAAHLRNLVAAASRQADHVFLVDDSGSVEVRTLLDSDYVDVNGLEIHHMPANFGIAAALNRGLAAARLRGYKKAVLLDDDTRITPHLIVSLAHAWQRLEREGHVPGVIGVSRAKTLPITKFDDKKASDWLSVRGVITAGSMVDIEIVERIGGFREEFIIDAVDYEFCARVRLNGMLVARLSAPLIEQPVGEMTSVTFAGITFSTTNHSPLRRYYMYRNNLIFAKEQIVRDPLLSMAIFWFLMKTVFLIVCFEKQKARKMKAIYRGVLDSIMRRMGHAERND